MKIAKILCVNGKVFKKIQWEFWSFLKDNKVPRKPTPKRKPKVKIKPIKIAPLTPNHLIPLNGADSLGKLYNHRVGRLNDWHELYGQGMYED